MIAPSEKDRFYIERTAELLQLNIIEKAEISPDGKILRVPALNEEVESGLVELLAKAIASWVNPLIKDREKTSVVTIESRGQILADEVAEALYLPSPLEIIRRGKPTDLSGEVLTRKVHPFAKKQTDQIYVEKSQLEGKKLVVIDNLTTSGETLEAITSIAKEAGGEVVALAVAVSIPSQGSKRILESFPSFSVVTVEEMIPKREGQPAMIKFAGQELRPLEKPGLSRLNTK